MASVNIILKSRKGDKNEEGTLYLQIIKNRSDKSEISLRQKLNPSLWDNVRQRISSTHRHSSKLNIFITNEKNAYQSIINGKLAQGIPFTVKEIVKDRKEELNPSTNKDSFISYFKEYIDTNPENLGFNTMQSYRTCYNKVVEFTPTLGFGQFNEKWVQKFEKHLLKQSQAVNTIADKMKVLKKMARVLIRNGKLQSSPFSNYKSKSEPGKREYLTKEEFKLLCDLETHSETDQWVKDTFIFGCLTGLRFSDISTLSSSNINLEDDNGKVVHRLSLKMQKTREYISFKLPIKAVRIIDRYNYPNSNPLLPILKASADRFNSEAALKVAINRRNAYFNIVIKKLCKQVGITKSISMHCARHTFATLSLDLDVKIQVVSKMLGHASLKETMIYAKIMDKQKDAAIDKWDKI
jgi:site-specific recombinase XerD